MSQAEELLDSLDETIPTHQHDVIDSDSYFIIDPITRAVENTSGSKNLLMQYDHASERYTFELPRYVEGHDMSLCTAVKVHYNNIESGTLIENADVNDLDDLHVDPTDANKVICSWLIKRQATQLVGSLNFLVQYLCATSDGTITYEWHSDIYKNIEIREGRNNGPAAVSDYTDILEQWRAKLSGADVLKKDNTEEYTPTEDYHPATKKYVDESINELSEEIVELEESGIGGSGGQPIVAKTASSMSDTTAIYLYLGEGETVNNVEYVNGYIYTYDTDNDTWKNSGLYGKGQNGSDGVSPTATTEQTEDGVKITITDKNGTTTATVTNGKDGADGKDGTATDEQVQTFVNAWLDEHPEAVTGVSDGAITTEKLAKDLRDTLKLGLKDECVGNVTDLYDKELDYAYKSNMGQVAGKSKAWKVKAGDVLYTVGTGFSSQSSLYNISVFTDESMNPLSVVGGNSADYGMSLAAASVDGYFAINTEYNGTTFDDLVLYKNQFIDKAYLEKVFDGNTLSNITDGTMKSLKGIVASPNPKIKYEVGYYIAYTNRHEVINFPSICMRNGDIVYYDGEYFNHVSSKGTVAINKNKHYDVIIVGSGASGIATALNLIGTGMNVAIIEKNKHLGGTHTCAGVIELCPSPVDDSMKEVIKAAWEDGYARFSTFNYVFGDGDTFDKYWRGSHLNWATSATATSPSSLGNKIILDKYYLQQYYYEKLVDNGIDVYLDTEIVDAVYDGEYIRAVIDSNGRVYNANFFVDAGGSIIIRKCGEMDTDYYFGYDGSTRFGESKVTNAEPNKEIINIPTLGYEQFTTPNATEIGSLPTIYAPFESIVSGTMGSWTVPRSGQGCKYGRVQEWLYAHPTQNPYVGGYSATTLSCRIGKDNLGITAKELLENDERKIYAKYRTKAIIQGRTNASDVSLNYAEPNEMLGIREGYRLNALYMGTQADCETPLTELGNCSILSSWYHEVHKMGGTSKHTFHSLVGLPIQSMMSAKFKNYLNPSKDKGLSNFAHSTFRLTKTCWLSGRLSAEILKLVWQKTNDVTGVDVDTVNTNAGITELFAELRGYIDAQS